MNAASPALPAVVKPEVKPEVKPKVKQESRPKKRQKGVPACIDLTMWSVCAQHHHHMSCTVASVKFDSLFFLAEYTVTF